MRTSLFHELEKVVRKWFNIVREQKDAVSGAKKALKYAKEMGLRDFAASDGWLDHFKMRENLDTKAFSTRFLVADTRLYSLQCQSIRPSVRPSVRNNSQIASGF